MYIYIYTYANQYLFSQKSVCPLGSVIVEHLCECRIRNGALNNIWGMVWRTKRRDNAGGVKDTLKFRIGD